MAHAERGRLVYQDDHGLLDLPLPKLLGAHQVENAGLAVAALRRSGIPLFPKAIEAGLTNADWPARMQRLKTGPLVDLAPAGSDIWLDGGHNPAAGVVIAQAFAEIEDRDPRPLILISGLLTSKDPAGFFRPFAGLVRHAMTVPVPGSDASFDPERLAELAMEVELPAKAFPSVRAALASLRQSQSENEPPRILICGSLYLAGDVLKENGPLPE
jgi:dihydrofolate synthase/folylpolyglutamate synthase